MTRQASRAAHLPKGGMPIFYDRAAGIDIGSRFHVVAVPPELCEVPVRTFQGFTGDLEQMADWLVSIGIQTVAMESTGVYWVPVYEVLRDRGIDVIVANAREARMVPGRKSDINDAQWLQRLHACGLLRPSFRPDRDIAALRSYLRLRERHLDYSSAHIQHMQKALTLMNLQLHHVISDITGTTGLRIIRAIVAGQHDPAVLAAMRDVRCKASVETVCSALSGNYQPEHLFALSQALALYDFYQARLVECDSRIERTLNSLNTRTQAPAEPLPKPRHKTVQPNALHFDPRPLLVRVDPVPQRNLSHRSPRLQRLLNYPPTLPSAPTPTKTGLQPATQINLNHPNIITAQPSRVHPVHTGRLPYFRCEAACSFFRSPRLSMEAPDAARPPPKRRPCCLRVCHQQGHNADEGSN